METETTTNTPIVRAVGVIDENKNFIPYGSTAVAKGIPVFVFNTKAEYDEHAPTLPEPCVVITLDDIDTGGFEFDSELSDTSENAVQNKVIKAALEALKEKASFTTPGMVQFTDATTVTDRNSGYALSAIEKNASVEGSLSNKINANTNSINMCAKINGLGQLRKIEFISGDHNVIHNIYNSIPAVPTSSNFMYILMKELNGTIDVVVAFSISAYERRNFIYRLGATGWETTEPTQAVQ